MKKLFKHLRKDELLKLICGYLIIGAFAGILISLFGMIWMGLDYDNCVFPRLMATNIIIIILSKAGWDALKI